MTPWPTLRKIMPVSRSRAVRRCAGNRCAARLRGAATIGELIGIAITAAILLASGTWLGKALANWNAPPSVHAIAQRLLDDGRAHEAAQLFEDPAWRGVAMYRAGRYQRAAAQFAQGQDADAAYNLGNAYVRLRRYDDAQRAYQVALARDPGHQHARENLELVRQLEPRKREESPSSGSTPPQGEPTEEPEGSSEDGEELAEKPRNIEQRTSENPSEESTETPGNEPPGLQRQQAAQSADARSNDQTQEQRLEQAIGATARSDEEPRDEPDDEADPIGSAEPDSLPATSAERALAERIELRRLVDDPALVLRARLRAAARARE